MDRIMWEGFLRALTYGITMSPRPLEDVDLAFRVAINKRALGGSPADYLDAIAAGLASDENLAEVIGLEQSDETVRAYLRAVEARLRAQLGRG